MDPTKHFIGHDLEHTEWKQKFRYAENYVIWMEKGLSHLPLGLGVISVTYFLTFVNQFGANLGFRILMP